MPSNMTARRGALAREARRVTVRQIPPRRDAGGQFVPRGAPMFPPETIRARVASGRYLADILGGPRDASGRPARRGRACDRYRTDAGPCRGPARAYRVPDAAVGTVRTGTRHATLCDAHAH